MALYNYDSNAIIATGVKGRKGVQLVPAYKTLYYKLSKVGIKPVLQRLKNEASIALINAIMDKGLKYQLVSP